MPLWNRNLHLHKRRNKTSLQERNSVKKTLIDSLKHPNFPKDPKEVSCFALLFKGVNGSLTAEAALVLPLFLFALINILSLFLMFESYGSQLAKLHQTGRQLAVLAYAQGEAVQEQDIELMQVDIVKPLIGMMGYPGTPVVTGCVMHKWIGYELLGSASGGTTAAEMVYLTESGSVYHTARNCAYLNPKIQSVSAVQAVSMKNEDGECYTACNTCGGQSDIVYVTAAGNRYHASISCSGLKRTVDCVTLQTAQELGRYACVRCSG